MVLSGAGQNEGMKGYRPRAVLLLFLFLNLTACSSWQNIGPVSPGRFIELDQPDRVRVTGGSVIELEVVSPSVEGDQLVGAGDVAVRLEDILRLEVRRISMDRTVLAMLGGVVLVPVALIAWMIIDCGGQSFSMCE